MTIVEKIEKSDYIIEVRRNINKYQTTATNNEPDVRYFLLTLRD